MAGSIIQPTAFDAKGMRLKEGDRVIVVGGVHAPASLPHRLIRESGVITKVFSGGEKVVVEFTGPSSWEKPRRFHPKALERKPWICAVCSEKVEPDGGIWIHPHSGEAYCYTGDGAKAMPKED